ncbi:MAG: AbrB/MazE/SpoVT family DNA-binding domain-containing protein [Tepidisphaeraceae bacterium]|jgi:antitoxin MazE
MATAVQKWGNSLGIRIPKALASQIHLTAGTEVEFETANGALTIRPTRRRKYSLSRLLAQAKGPNPHGEWDSLAPAGRETV